MQKLLCNVQKFRRNAIHNVWLTMSKKRKSTVDFMVFHPTRQNPFSITARVRIKAQVMTTTLQKALFLKPIFTYRTLHPFDVIIHGIVRFQAESTYILILSILNVSTFWAIPLSVMWLCTSAHVVKLQVWYFVF